MNKALTLFSLFLIFSNVSFTFCAGGRGGGPRMGPKEQEMDRPAPAIEVSITNHSPSTVEELLCLCSPSAVPDLTQLQQLQEHDESVKILMAVADKRKSDWYSWTYHEGLVAQKKCETNGRKLYMSIGQIYKERKGDENKCTAAAYLRKANVLVPAGDALLAAASEPDYRYYVVKPEEITPTKKALYVQAALTLIDQGLEKGESWDGATHFFYLAKDDLKDYVDENTRAHFAWNNPSSAFLYAEERKEKGDYVTAIEFFQRATKSQRPAFYEIAQCYVAENELLLADAAFKLAVARDVWEAMIPYGKFLRDSMHDPEGAKKQFERARICFKQREDPHALAELEEEASRQELDVVTKRLKISY